MGSHGENSNIFEHSTLGAGAPQRSTLRHKVNREEHGAVPTEFRRWVWVGGRKLKGLIRRREAEAVLYAGSPKHEVTDQCAMSHVQAWSLNRPAPSAAVRARSAQQRSPHMFLQR